MAAVEIDAKSVENRGGGRNPSLSHAISRDQGSLFCIFDRVMVSFVAEDSPRCNLLRFATPGTRTFRVEKTNKTLSRLYVWSICALSASFVASGATGLGFLIKSFHGVSVQKHCFDTEVDDTILAEKIQALLLVATGLVTITLMLIIAFLSSKGPIGTLTRNLSSVNSIINLIHDTGDKFRSLEDDNDSDDSERNENNNSNHSNNNNNNNNNNDDDNNAEHNIRKFFTFRSHRGGVFCSVPNALSLAMSVWRQHIVFAAMSILSFATGTASIVSGADRLTVNSLLPLMGLIFLGFFDLTSAAVRIQPSLIKTLMISICIEFVAFYVIAFFGERRCLEWESPYWYLSKVALSARLAWLVLWIQFAVRKFDNPEAPWSKKIISERIVNEVYSLRVITRN